MSDLVKIDETGKKTDDNLSENAEEARKKSFERLSEKALLISLRKKTFANFPYDPALTDDVAKKYLKSDNPSMLCVRKFIINPKHLKKIRSLANDALLIVFNYTRPWDNVDFRILPMELWDDFNSTFSKISDEYEEAVQEFKANYKTYKKEAKKELGNAFNPRDYPDESALDELFELKIETSNFPDIDDIRLNLTGDDLIAVEKAAVEKYSSAISSAKGDLLKQLSQIKDAINGGKAIDKDFAMSTINIIDKLNIDNDSQISVELIAVKEMVKVSLGLPDEPTKVETNDEPSEEDMMLTSDVDLDDLDDFMVS